jgi:hypothetical protein
MFKRILPWFLTSVLCLIIGGSAVFTLNRAFSTGEGLPRYSAAPSTTMTSAERVSSRVDWR